MRDFTYQDLMAVYQASFAQQKWEERLLTIAIALAFIATAFLIQLCLTSQWLLCLAVSAVAESLMVSLWLAFVAIYRLTQSQADFYYGSYWALLGGPIAGAGLGICAWLINRAPFYNHASLTAVLAGPMLFLFVSIALRTGLGKIADFARRSWAPSEEQALVASFNADLPAFLFYALPHCVVVSGVAGLVASGTALIL